MRPERPADLVYGLDERPPVLKLVLLAIQQVFMVALYLVLITVIVDKAQVSQQIAQTMMSLTLLVMGIAAAIQAIWKGPIGSGFLAPSCVAPNYLQASLTAITVGGIPLLSGMMIFSGCCEGLFGFFSKKLRFLFPRVVCGLIFCFIAFDVGIVALSKVFTATLLQVGIYGFTLALIIALNVWGKGVLRLLCIIVSLVVGSVLAYFLNLFSAQGLQHLSQATYFKLPNISSIHYAFSWAVAPLFVVTALAASLRTIGVLTTCQQINNANWKRPDLVSIRKGVLADGVSAAASGLFGTMGVGVSPSAVGISKATGATSRSIAFVVAIFCTIFAFIPKIAALFLSLPLVVVAAGLTFASCLMFVGGLRIITSQELDARKSILVGLSLLLSLTPKIFPDYFAMLPGAVRPIASSVMVLGTLSAIVLNLIFRIGIRRKYKFVLENESEAPFQTMKTTLGDWKIDSFLADSMLESTRSLCDLIIGGHYSLSNIDGDIDYDELKLKINLRYLGNLPKITLDEPITETDLVEENVFIKGLSSLYKDIYPDTIDCHKEGEQVEIKLVFLL